MAELVFEQVHYQYPKAKKETLRGVDAVFRAGETSSIVGHSGAGKSCGIWIPTAEIRSPPSASPICFFPPAQPWKTSYIRCSWRNLCRPRHPKPG